MSPCPEKGLAHSEFSAHWTTVNPDPLRGHRERVTMEYLWMEGCTGEKTGRREGMLHSRNRIRGHTSDLSWWVLGMVQEAQANQRLTREHPLLQWDPTGLRQGLPCPVSAGIWNRGSLLLLWNKGNPVAASFAGLGQSSVIALSSKTDLGFKMTHFFPPAMTTFPEPPPSSWAWPAVTVLASSLNGREFPWLPQKGLNTHCALEVSKTASAHKVFLSSSKSFDLPEPYTTPSPHHGETFLVQSQQNPNRPPDFLTIWCFQALACSHSLFVLQGTLSFGWRLPQRKNNLMCDKPLWLLAGQGGPIRPGSN